MLNLKEYQYDRQTLKNHIYAVDLLELLKTQHIDVTFAVRYLLNKNYDYFLDILHLKWGG